MRTPLDKCLVSKIPHSGSGLCASHDIGDQELIVELERPFVCVPVNDMLDRVCYDCLKPKRELMRCLRCKAVRFCSRNCQIASWTEVHKMECKIFQRLGDLGRPVLPTPVRAALQVVLRRGETQPANAPKLLDLVAHQDSFDQKALGDIALQARAIIEYARLPSELLSFAMGVLERIQFNAFHGRNEERTARFLCFDPSLAMVNHSCIPNAYLTFNGRTALLKCASPIKASEQITICYIDPDLSVELRLQQLKTNYLFDCRCERCETESAALVRPQSSTSSPTSCGRPPPPYQ